MTDEPKSIELYEEDLEALYNTLGSVYHFCLSYDLFNQYKNLSNSVQTSALTKEVKRMHNRLGGYLVELQEEEEEDGDS